MIDAVRVPPSAWITSQSRVMVCSPSCSRLIAARSERPINRWISCVRPPWRPRTASRSLRVFVARGSMPYSAVTQPELLPRSQPGTRGSTLAAQSTLVSPKETIVEPSACLSTSSSIRHRPLVARAAASRSFEHRASSRWCGGTWRRGSGRFAGGSVARYARASAPPPRGRECEEAHALLSPLRGRARPDTPRADRPVSHSRSRMAPAPSKGLVAASSVTRAG